MALVRAGRGFYDDQQRLPDQPEPEPTPRGDDSSPRVTYPDPNVGGPFRAPGPVVGGGDIAGAYRAALGRDPDATELASETENLGKYGFAQLESNLTDRARSNGNPEGRTVDSQSAAGNFLYGSGTGNTTNTPGGPFKSAGAPRSGPFPGNEFDDPATHFAEQYAGERFGQRTSPAQGSGTALYEAFAKDFANLLKGDVFSDQEEAALRTRAFDRLEQDKQSELRVKQEELGRRRIGPQSGVYISEMNRIRDKWDRLKASNENQLLTDSISERQRRLTQAFSVLGTLAASEEGRYDAALALSMIPLQLQDRAFGRLDSAVNMGGNSSAMTQQLMQLLSIATNSQQYNDQQRYASLSAIGEWLGGLL